MGRTRRRISWFRSNDLWVMGPARFLCAMTRAVGCSIVQERRVFVVGEQQRTPTTALTHDTPAGNRTRGERMGTVHFTTKPLVCLLSVGATPHPATFAETVDRTRDLQIFSLTLSQLSYFGGTHLHTFGCSSKACACSLRFSQWRARTADLGFIRPTL